MASSVNKVILVGNLGRDPEVRRLNSGEPVVNLRVATSESWKDKATGERKEKTEWHSVVIFNENLARVAEQYLKKGSKVYLEGQLQTRKWTDQQGAGEVLHRGRPAALPRRAHPPRRPRLRGPRAPGERDRGRFRPRRADGTPRRSGAAREPDARADGRHPVLTRTGAPAGHAGAPARKASSASRASACGSAR